MAIGVSQEAEGMGGGMVEAVGFPQPLHTVRGPVSSANRLYQAQGTLKFTLPLMSRIFMSAGPAHSEAISEYSQHFGICGF